MFFQGWRLHLVLVACLLSAGVLLGGQHVYREFFVQRPLMETLRAEKGVQGVRLERTGNTEKVMVELEPVDSLKQTYLRLEQLLHRFYPDGKVELIVVDHRSPALEQVWGRCQFAVYEAAVRGNFTTMAEEVEKETQEQGVKLKLDVDRGHIYVALFQGSSYLYEIVPRETPGRGEDGGGEIDGA
ncbi:MAG: hypothetical protein ACPL5F_00815 [Moorellaceae bacterium]